MTTRDFTANVISASKVVPDGNFKDSKASGVWDINEALDLIKGGNWPNAANINPAAFVDALFQPTLWTGTQQARTITNGIDFTKGGMIYVARRDGGDSRSLYDTENGTNTALRPNDTAALIADTDSITAFNNNGFSMGTGYTQHSLNLNNGEYVGWCFRKQPKFFDIVTYSGTGSAQAIAHSLNSTVGMIIIKRTDSTTNYAVYHRGANGGTDPEDYHGVLNLTDEFSNNSGYFNDTAPTTTHFTAGDDSNVNASGGSYIAYLFAHNNNDGGFGEPGDQDIIKCGSYTGNGNATGPSINLGFEPQLVLIKLASHSGENWILMDNMRGMPVGSNDTLFELNDSGAEKSTSEILNLTPTGFDIKSTSNGINTNTYIYAYMAIRRGGMQTPTAASDVFAIDTHGDTAPTPPAWNSGFPVDMAIYKNITSSSGNWVLSGRLTGTKSLKTNTNESEGNDNSILFDYQNGYYDGTGSLSNFVSWMWKRARGYFDVVTYTGNDTLRTINHNLGVVPEMMWLKRRDSSDIWYVYHSALGAGKRLTLHETDAESSDTSTMNNTAPTASVFTLNTNVNHVNANNSTYVAFLFATLAGVSKVGSYTGNAGASTINVDCGFTGDTPSFILIKESSGTGNWWVFDSKRGIVASTEKALYLNATDAETSAFDYIDPYSGGFSLSTNSGINTDGATFIFYAIAAIS